jgi:hypothetical protein
VAETEFWLLLTGDYARVTAHGTGQTVSPLAFPEMGFAVGDFFA